MGSVDELWLVDFGEPYPSDPAWHRPALILGPPESFGHGFPFVIVAPLTTAPRGLSLHVEVAAEPHTGLDATSYIQCELIRSINKNRLIHHLGRVGHETSAEVTDIIKTLLNH